VIALGVLAIDAVAIDANRHGACGAHQALRVTKNL
jgi:hypothetical protein